MPLATALKWLLVLTREVVSQTFASWYRVAEWLRRLETLR